MGGSKALAEGENKGESDNGGLKESKMRKNKEITERKKRKQKKYDFKKNEINQQQLKIRMTRKIV